MLQFLFPFWLFLVLAITFLLGFIFYGVCRFTRQARKQASRQASVPAGSTGTAHARDWHARACVDPPAMTEKNGARSDPRHDHLVLCSILGYVNGVWLLLQF